MNNQAIIHSALFMSKFDNHGQSNFSEFYLVSFLKEKYDKNRHIIVETCHSCLLINMS